MLGQSISKNALLLGLFAIVSTLIIAGTYLSTVPMIKQNIREAEAKALLDVMPEDTHSNQLVDDSFPIDDQAYLGLREEKNYYLARQGDEVVGIILPLTARDGYTGDIDLILGIWSSGEIAGARVLSHRETPGLGDQVDRKKSDWIESFSGKSLSNPAGDLWKVKKDGGVFDQFTGATITPRAVTAAIYRALNFFEQHKDSLLQGSAITGSTSAAIPDASLAKEEVTP